MTDVLKSPDLGDVVLEVTDRSVVGDENFFFFTLGGARREPDGKTSHLISETDIGMTVLYVYLLDSSGVVRTPNRHLFISQT